MKETSCQGQLTRDPHDKDPFKKKQSMTVSEGLFKEKDVEKKLQRAHLEARAVEKAIEAIRWSKMDRTSYEGLVADLRNFRLKCTPVSEAEIENGVEQFLKTKRFPVHRQVAMEKGRFDLAVGKFIIEVKIIGQRKVVEQLDRYSAFCEGLILLCWKATGPVKKIFAVAKSQSKIPVELIEVSKNCDLV